MKLTITKKEKFDWFIYDIEGNIFEGKPGQLISEILNFDWQQFSDLYLYALNESCERFENHTNQSNLEKYRQIHNSPITIHFMDDQILSDRLFQEIVDTKKLVDFIISSLGEITTDKDFFYFSFTEFFEYKTVYPYKYKYSFCDVLFTLIDNYCSAVKSDNKYLELKQEYFIPHHSKTKKTQETHYSIAQKIFNAPNIKETIIDSSGDPQNFESYLYRVIDYLCNFYKIKEVSDYRTINGKEKLINISDGEIYHAKQIISLIHDYLFPSIEIEETFNDLFNPDIDLWHKAMKKSQNSISSLVDNAGNKHSSSFAFSSEGYKSFLIKYFYQNKSASNRNNYYFNNLSDLICHAVLYCFENNLSPLQICKQCGFVFPRESNSQKNCSKCKGKKGGFNELAIEYFDIDFDLFKKQLLKRMCKPSVKNGNVYQGTTTNCYEEEETETIATLNELITKIYHNEMKYYIELYQAMLLIEDNSAEDFKKTVKFWHKKIDEKYNKTAVKKAFDNYYNDKLSVYSISIPQYVIKSHYEIDKTKNILKKKWKVTELEYKLIQNPPIWRNQNFL